MAETTIDRVLRVLDVGLQHSDETGYPTAPAPGDIDYHRAPTDPTPCQPAAHPSRIARVWRDRIDSGRFTKAQCSQFGFSAARLAAGFSARGWRSNLTAPEAVELVAALRARGGVLLTPEHEAQGLAWLHRHGAKVLGWPAEFADDILARFRCFTFRGDVKVSGPCYGTTLPIWRVHLNDGRQLDYYNAAWQSQPWQGERVAPAWWWIDNPTERTPT